MQIRQQRIIKKINYDGIMTVSTNSKIIKKKTVFLLMQQKCYGLDAICLCMRLTFLGIVKMSSRKIQISPELVLLKAVINDT